MPRIEGKWEKVRDNIIGRLIRECNVGQGRISHKGNARIIVKLVTTRDDFEQCLRNVINDLKGKVTKWERRGKKAEGTEWEYTVVFMADEDQPFDESEEEE